MSKAEIVKNDLDQLNEVDPLEKLKKSIDLKTEGVFLCEKKKHNPNYLSIIYANKYFYDFFAITPFNLIGKSYDFLFSSLDVDYASDDQLEYIRLIKAVKDFHACSVIITLTNHKPDPEKIRFKINFTPSTDKELDPNTDHHAIFTFEKVEIPTSHPTPDGAKTNVMLLKNLERTLRSERLLREIGYLIISDLPIRDIAQNIAKILSAHLKVDRCLLHDYNEGITNFVVENCAKDVKSMLGEKQNSENLKILTDYINFQNHFYEKHGSKTTKSSMSVVEDISNDRNFLQIENIIEKYSITSQIAVTTIFNNKVNGGIYIHQSQKRNWLPDEIELIEMVSDQFSIAVDRSNSIEKVMVANHALMEKTAQLKEALKQEQNMRQMQNEFVALVSHEFKTPLQIIDSTREILSRKLKTYNADESITKSLDRIKGGIQRMNGLIHSTLNLAKMESGENKIKLESQNFNLKEFVQDIIDKNLNLASIKNITIVTKINELPAIFNGDQKLLDHSITNIVSNAIKYSRNNSTIKILAKANDKKVALRVIDQGIGIPQEDLSHIGQKFFRAKNTLSVAGTGIGIYLTKHFIELHGGDVLIESEVNVGTSVTITLPRQ